jgi:ribonuclease G
LVKKVRLYNKKKPILDEFNVHAELEKALKSKVWLKSGGSIVINQTEALVAIDVNTGKYVGRTNSLEDTIAKTNLDAVKEVVRQIRLRDLGGIIVIDFIDMNDFANQKRVLGALQDELGKDKSPSKILPFNEFGLVAITRKRVRQSLERTLCQPCACCEGTGMTKSVRTVCQSIYAEVLRSRAAMKKGKELIVRCHPDVGNALSGSEKDVADEIRNITGKKLSIRTDPLMHIGQFEFAGK